MPRSTDVIGRVGIIILMANALLALPARGAETITPTATPPPCPARRTPDAYRPGPPTPGVNVTTRIEDARRLSRRGDTPDSVAYALAIELWGLGTIESREQALQALSDIRPAYEKLPEYHWRRALIYEDREERALALDAMERVTALDPFDVEGFVESARLELQGILYQFDLSLVPDLLWTIHTALRLCPDHRKALLLDALACEMAGGLPEHADPLLLAEGLGATDRILATNDRDLEARLLRAVILDDLGRPEEGERDFNLALDSAPEEMKSAFTSLEWTAPAAALDAEKKMDDPTRARFETAYWRRFDPSPLSLVNESQVVIRKRLVLADLLFGKPDEGKRGWTTDPGRIFVRYGAPLSSEFDPGDILVLGGTDQSLPRSFLGFSAANAPNSIKLLPPSWNWDYRFRDLHFVIRFEDRSLDGNFYLDEASHYVADYLRASVPTVFHEAPPGKIRGVTLATAGVAAPGRLVTQAIELGIPLWRPAEGGRWLDKVSLEIVVKDSLRVPVGRAVRRATADDLGNFFDDSLGVVVAREVFDLRPGRYWASAFVEDGEKKWRGVGTMPFTVGTFAETKGLRISDIDLSLDPAPAGGEPHIHRLGEDLRLDPLRIVENDRRLFAYYELYGLTRKNGASLHRVRYTVLPRNFILEYERLARRGDVDPDSIVAFAAEQLKEGGDDLTPENSVDVFFPMASLDLATDQTPKGAQVPIRELGTGEYGLIVTVTDVLSGHTTSNRAFFRILDTDQLHELTGYASKR